MSIAESLSAEHVTRRQESCPSLSLFLRDDRNAVANRRFVSVSDATDTRHRALITLVVVRRTKQTGPSSEISCRHVNHASATSTAIETAAFKTRAIKKELGYKNADRASKLAALETETEGAAWARGLGGTRAFASNTTVHRSHMVSRSSDTLLQRTNSVALSPQSNYTD
jgi:hypothetical protein